MAIAKVCVIEDDAGIRETVRDLLTDEGYEVIQAANGLEGKRILENSQEGLIVVLDYRLPVLDGCDLLEIVAQDKQLQARHTFIMMSASPAKTIEDCEEAIDELVVPVIPKPFDIDELVEAVRQAEDRLEPGSTPAQAGS
jgi:two-component system, response regulator, stage 0 sporulation protein F